MVRRPTLVLASAASLVAATLVPTSALAQAKPDTSQRAAIVGPAESLLHGGEMGELLAVYVPRGASEVQHQLDDARTSDRAAATAVDGTRRLADDADGRARITREELQSNRVRYDVARKSGDPTATASPPPHTSARSSWSWPRPRSTTSWS